MLMFGLSIKHQPNSKSRNQIKLDITLTWKQSINNSSHRLTCCSKRTALALCESQGSEDGSIGSNVRQSSVTSF